MYKWYASSRYRTTKQTDTSACCLNKMSSLRSEGRGWVGEWGGDVGWGLSGAGFKGGIATSAGHLSKSVLRCWAIIKSTEM